MKTKPKKKTVQPTPPVLASDLGELTLLACSIRHNAREMRNALACMDRIADTLEANRARLKVQADRQKAICLGERLVLKKTANAWYLISPTCLTWWDKLRLLLGWKLYVRFDSPNGQCSAGCDHSWAVSRAKYADDKLPWRWGNNWHKPNITNEPE